MATATADTDEPTGPVRGIAAFRPGVHNGLPHSPEFLRQLVANFQKFSTGPAPHYTPYVSLNHDDGLACGDVTAATLDGPEPQLVLDADNVPDTVRAWAKGGRLRQPSIEYFEPERDPKTGRVIDGFRDPDGHVVETPVLKALTLLGNKPPAVKGLKPLSAARFTHTGGVVRRFSGEAIMDRQAMLQALQAAGMDVSAVTDAVPDAVLQAMLACVQKAAATAPGTTQTMSDDDDTDDDDKGGTQTMTHAGGTVKFTDRTGAQRTGTLADFVADQQAQLDALRAGQTALARDQQQRLTEAKRDKVRRFCDELGVAGQLVPAARPAMEQLLLNCDDVTVRKFADGKTDGSELAERMAALKAALPVVRKFGDKLADPLTGTGQPALSDADRTAMLKATPLGRAALAARK
jgi:hypothetical protein